MIVNTTVKMFVMIEMRVPAITLCTPATSLLMREMISPLRVLVKKTQRHALHVPKEMLAQVVDDSLADQGVQVALQHADQAREERQRDHADDEQVEQTVVSIRYGGVDDAAHQQRRDQAKAGDCQYAGENDDFMRPVRCQVAQDAAYAGGSQRHFGLTLVITIRPMHSPSAATIHHASCSIIVVLLRKVICSPRNLATKHMQSNTFRHRLCARPNRPHPPVAQVCNLRLLNVAPVQRSKGRHICSD